MLSEMLSSSNPLVKYGVGALIVFGPLYILSSYGVGFVWPVALIIGLGLLLKQIGEQQRKF